MKTKKMTISYLIFLGLILISALRYIDLGEWKAYVALFGRVELFVVITAIILFAIKKTRFIAPKYVCVLLGIMQFFPMIMAFKLSGQYTIYGIFHVIMEACCISMIIVNSRTKNDGVTG